MDLEKVKLKNFVLAVNPELYKILWPEDFEEEKEDDEGIKYLVPKDESELKGIFEDLRSLGINVRDEELPQTRTFDTLAKAVERGQSIENIDALLEEEIRKMRQPIKVEFD